MGLSFQSTSSALAPAEGMFKTAGMSMASKRLDCIFSQCGDPTRNLFSISFLLVSCGRILRATHNISSPDVITLAMMGSAPLQRTINI